MSDVLQLTQQLISCKSISPHDANCQSIISERLQSLGFHIEQLDCEDTKNLYARHGTAQPCFMFLGHTDVVPPGPLDAWTSPPFAPSVRNGKLYGRGSADMKASVAAMVVALERLVQHNPKHPGSIGLLLTSDEEAKATHGIRHVAQVFAQRGEHIDYCCVGEPSCEQYFGDTIKIGRRGSLNGTLTIVGKQGHIAYPDKALNPIPIAADIIHALAAEKWDDGNEDFPATTWQVSNINAGTGADNVIPHAVELSFNFRFSPESSPTQLQQRTQGIIERLHDNYHLTWRLSGDSFYCKNMHYINTVQTIIEQNSHIKPQTSCLGGTSDGRFIAPLGTDVIEFGPINTSIHQIDEWVDVDCLENLSIIYQQICHAMVIN